MSSLPASTSQPTAHLQAIFWRIRLFYGSSTALSTAQIARRPAASYQSRGSVHTRFVKYSTYGIFGTGFLRRSGNTFCVHP